MSKTTKSSGGEITALLNRWDQGDKEARNALFTQLYPDLKRIARYSLRTMGMDNNTTLQTTLLAHECYLKLVDIKTVPENSKTFIRFVFRAMRWFLIDYIRKGKWPDPEELKAHREWETKIPEHLIARDQALALLAELDPLKAAIADLRIREQMKLKDISARLAIDGKGPIPEGTVRRLWHEARLFLTEKLKN